MPATLPQPLSCCCREPGWAGVAVASGQPSQAAVARHFARDVTLFDGPMAVRTLHTMYRPTAVQLLSTSLAAGPQGGPLVAVAEGPQVSIWDVRGAGRGARVAKLTPGPHHGHLLCLAATEDGSSLPLIGGAGRFVGGWVGGHHPAVPSCVPPAAACSQPALCSPWLPHQTAVLGCYSSAAGAGGHAHRPAGCPNLFVCLQVPRAWSGLCWCGSLASGCCWTAGPTASNTRPPGCTLPRVGG